MLRGFSSGRIFGDFIPGDGGLVVCMHGWARTKEDFLPFISELQTGCDRLAISRPTILNLDLPGFGSSPPPEAAVGTAWYAEMLEEALVSLDLELNSPDTVLLGHSFGGRVAVSHSAIAKRPPCAMVLAGVPLIRIKPKARPSMKFQFARKLRSLGLLSEGSMDKIRDQLGSSDYRATQGVMRQVFVKTVNEDYQSLISAIESKVYLVSGELDDQVPPEVAKEVNAISRNATSEVLEGIGHFIPTQAPAKLAEVLLGALMGCDR